MTPSPRPPARVAPADERPLYVGAGNFRVRCELCGRLFVHPNPAHARSHMAGEHYVIPSAGPKLVVRERITAERYEYVLTPEAT